MPKDTSLSPRWGKAHTAALNKMFMDSVWDPQETSQAYLDECYQNLPDDSVLSEIKQVNFRSHYREKAITYLNGVALNGVRLSEFSSY